MHKYCNEVVVKKHTSVQLLIIVSQKHIVLGLDRGMLLVSDVKVMFREKTWLLIGYCCVQHICMNHVISGDRVF